MIKADVGASVHNKFEFRLIDKNGNVKQEVVAYNTVTNLYYSKLNSVDTLLFNYVALGTGTGTPSVADTALFTFLASKSSGLTRPGIQYVDVNKFKLSSSVTFNEAEAVGEITEIGLQEQDSGSNPLLYTHALITDAEGHVISINKTDVDRLIITITLYLELSLPDSILPFYGAGYFNYSYYGDQQVTTAFTGVSTARAPLGKFFGTVSTWATVCNNTISFAVSPGGTAITRGAPSMPVSLSKTSTGVRVQSTSRILSDAGNLPGTYQIYGFITPLGYMPITPNIFTPITLELTQIADGTKTGFNFKIPELSDDGLEVYINDVLQPASSYTWNGMDYVNSFQAWETTRADKVIVNPTTTYNYWGIYTTDGSLIFNNSINMGSDPTWSASKMVFDYGEAKTFTRAYKPSAGSAYSNWEYSNDNENWTTVSVPASPSTNYYDFPTPIVARYLRSNFSNLWSNNWTPSACLLCCYKDQLVFNTPPADGAIVKIKAKSLYPIKNSNWILDQFVLDFTISRGT